MSQLIVSDQKKMYLLTKDTLHTKAVHLLLSFINFDTVSFVR